MLPKTGGSGFWHHHCDGYPVNGSVSIVEPKADYSFDFSGAIRWLALLKFTRIFRSMASNQVAEIQGLDPDTRADLLKVLPEMSYEMLDVENHGAASGRLRLRKREIRVNSLHY